MMENNLIEEMFERNEGMISNEHVYANVREMEEENRKLEKPPLPLPTELALRTIGSDWHEYLTATGRSYFYNTDLNESYWKPPRFLKPPRELSNLETNDIETVKSTKADSDSHDEDSVASVSVSGSPVAATKSMSDMVESVDSGISRASISLKNKIIEKRMSVQPISHDIRARVDSFKSNEELAIEATSLLSTSYSNYGDFAHQSEITASVNRLPPTNQPQKPIKCGTVEKCTIAEEGMRLKKKEWSHCYLFLSQPYIIFYKDEKSAEKFGRHYEAPLGMGDLCGASIRWVDEICKRRKHVLQLELSNGTVHLFSTNNNQNINAWFHALRSVISKLPQFSNIQACKLERANCSIVRSGSALSQCHSSNFGGLQVRRSVKNLTRGQSKADERGAKSAGIEEMRLSRGTIIEKLKRFFRSRPSIESLKEKGIYKPEPVFGSTLAAICLHEQSTVPRFIQVVTEVIESKGIDTDGVYRVSGNLSAIQRIRLQVDQEKYGALLGEDDIHVLTGSLKLFFRELSEPIFPVFAAKDFINANRLSNGDNKLKTFDELLKKLPVVNRETLKILFGHLIRVASHADKNRMEIHNLAIMFGPSLFNSGYENAGSAGPKKMAGKKKPDKKAKGKEAPVQSNSHLAFNMIMQGQTVEYLLTEYHRLTAFQDLTLQL